MSNLENKGICRGIGIALSVIVLHLSAFSQEQPCSNCPEVFAVVHNLLSATYPELFTKDRYLQLTIGHPLDSPWPRIHGVDFKVLRFSPGTSFDFMVDGVTGKPSPNPKNIVLLWGHFWFDESDRLLQVEIAGDEARSNENEVARTFVESHPESADAAMLQVLKEKQARYGPTTRDGLMSSLPLEKLQGVFGQIEIKSATFYDFANPEHVGNFAELFWSVTIEVRQRDGAKMVYALTFEPFDGKLVGITRLRH